MTPSRRKGSRTVGPEMRGSRKSRPSSGTRGVRRGNAGGRPRPGKRSTRSGGRQQGQGGRRSGDRGNRGRLTVEVGDRRRRQGGSDQAGSGQGKNKS